MCDAGCCRSFTPISRTPATSRPLRSSISAMRTNVAPSWDRAQPFAFSPHGRDQYHLGHRARMTARASTLPDELRPIYTPSGSDSTSLDEVIELVLAMAARLPRRSRMVMPRRYRPSFGLSWPITATALSRGTDRRRFPYRTGTSLARRWIATACGLGRFFVTEDHLVVAGSEADWWISIPEDRAQRSPRPGPDDAGRS